MTMNLFSPATPRIHRSAPYEDRLSNPYEQSWVRQPVPLVKKSDTFRIAEWTVRDYDLVRAAQAYLHSRMDKASKKVRQTQTVQDLAHDSSSCSGVAPSRA